MVRLAGRRPAPHYDSSSFYCNPSHLSSTVDGGYNWPVTAFRLSKRPPPKPPSDLDRTPHAAEVLAYLGQGLVVADASGRIIEANDAVGALLGTPAGALVGRQLHACFPSDARSRFSEACRRAARENAAPTFTEYFANYDKWIEGCAFPWRDGVALAYRDVTLRRRAQLALGEAQTRLQLFMAQIPAIVWSTDDRLRITSIVGSGLTRACLTPSELIGRQLTDALAGIDAEPENMITHVEALEGRAGNHFADFGARTYDVHVEPLRDDAGMTVGTMGIALDVSERKAAEDRLAFLAHHDALTGLPNRILLMDRLAQSIARVRRRGRFSAVLFIDVDHFKSVNDTRGHAAGDELLKAIAARLTAAIRPGDTVARLGGDEFIVALDDVAHADDVSSVALRIVNAFAQPFEIGGQSLPVTCSVGASLSPRDGETAEALIQRADAAMYAAKQQGRNNVQFALTAINY